jgi:hypothetical protein
MDELNWTLGLSPDWGVSISHHSVRPLFLFSTMLLVIVIVGLVGGGMWWAYRHSLPSTGGPTGSSSFPLNYGADGTVDPLAAQDYTSSTCGGDGHSVVTDDGCRCTEDWYGPSCGWQRFPASYIGAGVAEGITGTVLASTGGGSKRDCATLASGTTGSGGFSYSAGTCTVWGDAVTVTGLPYSPTTEPTLYLSSLAGLTTPARVYLGNRRAPVRYWLPAPGWAPVAPGTVATLDFVPAYSEGSTGTGIFTLFPFTMDQASQILAQGNSPLVSIQPAGRPLALPPDWGEKLPIYVTYV